MAVAPRQNGLGLDQFNDGLRASPAWQSFMQRSGQPIDGRPIRLSEAQRRALYGELQRAGFQFPRGMEIDPAGNLNQDNTGFFEKKAVQIGLVSAAALTGLGAAGFGPLAGMFGGAGGASAAGGGTLASGSIPGLHAAVPGAVASQGASAGLAGGALAGGAIPGLHAAVPGAVASQNASAGLGTVLPAGIAGASAASRAGRGADDVADAAGGWQDIFTDPSNLAGLGGLIASLIGNRGDQSGAEEMRRIHDITEARMRRVDPLHQAVTQLAWGRLPTSSRQGVAAPVMSPLPERST